MRELLSIFTENFGIRITIIAMIVASADLVLYKFREKLPLYITNYLPLAIALAVSAVNGAIAFGSVLKANDLSAGIIAYSIGLALSAIGKKVFRGERLNGALTYLIREITAAVCKDDVASEIAAIILAASDNESDVVDNLADVLQKHAKENVSEAEILATVNLIILSTENFRKTK